MDLALERIHKKVGAQTWLYELDMALQSNAVTVLLGATQACGTDIDPQALEASRDNATRNGIDAARFPLYLPSEMPADTFDLVLANILAGPLVQLAPTISQHVRQGGHLVLSGILAEQAEEVRAAYQADFILDPTAEKDGWVRISGVRR